ncbi:flavodoxin family protein [Thiofilum flexile]|uniref:flavodoxin family protein n=1 Tax=Thiofilum flexile TaxID=125627 RepID=UPI000365BC88|nr:hypothetical protein [Thiofilum flexile]
MRPIVIIANTPTANTYALREAVARGAQQSTVPIQVLSPLEANSFHILQSSAVIVGTTENFGYMSGALKDFFERIYYPCLESTQGLPVALYVRAGNDGTGTVQSVTRILTGLRWKLIQEPLVFKGAWQPEFLKNAEELGEAVALGVELGVF